MRTINVTSFMKTPFDLICILWEVPCPVNGMVSGNTICEAWRGQYEIECLEKSGYTIIDVVKH